MYQSSWLVWSNIAWLVPSYIALQAGNYWLVVPAVLIMICSSSFHIYGTRQLELLDTAGALVYLALGPYLFIKSGQSLSAWLATSAVTASALGVWGLAKYYEKQGDQTKYVLVHSFWHIAAAMMAGFVYYLYLGG